jgi:hypothetical protein
LLILGGNSSFSEAYDAENSIGQEINLEKYQMDGEDSNE